MATTVESSFFGLATNTLKVRNNSLGGGRMSAHVYLSLLWFALQLVPKEDAFLASSCPAFASLLLADLK